MVKLIRNTLGDWGLLGDGHGWEIKWKFLVTAKWVRASLYHKNSMQLSTYCSKDLNIVTFEASEDTVLFCRNINNIFDVLNTRNLFEKTQYKKLLFKNSKDFIKCFVKTSDEETVFKSWRCKYHFESNRNLFFFVWLYV